MLSVLFGPIIGAIGMPCRLGKYLRAELKAYHAYTAYSAVGCTLYGVYVFLVLLPLMVLVGLMIGPITIYDDLVHGIIV